jgi:hypothetical protein
MGKIPEPAAEPLHRYSLLGNLKLSIEPNLNNKIPGTYK